MALREVDRLLAAEKPNRSLPGTRDFTETAEDFFGLSLQSTQAIQHDYLENLENLENLELPTLIQAINANLELLKHQLSEERDSKLREQAEMTRAAMEAFD